MPELHQLHPAAPPSPAPPPPPSPLPPPRLRKLLKTSAATRTTTTAEQSSPCLDSPASAPFRPVYYFFYGTLTHPHILKGVLGLDSESVLRSAKVYGFKLANWGQYRTLVDSRPDAVVVGCAYLVQSAEDEFKLAYYETNAYTVAGCRIHFTDGSEGHPVDGKTFKYAGDAEALKAGRFDRTLWERQMGRRLPPRWHGIGEAERDGGNLKEARPEPKGAVS